MTNNSQLAEVGRDATTAVGAQEVAPDVSTDGKSDKSDSDMVKVDSSTKEGSEVADDGEDTKNGSTNVSAKKEPPKPLDPLVIDTPYPATVFGLEAAKMQCRFMMNRIIAEVSARPLELYDMSLTEFCRSTLLPSILRSLSMRPDPCRT